MTIKVGERYTIRQDGDETARSVVVTVTRLQQYNERTVFVHYRWGSRWAFWKCDYMGAHGFAKAVKYATEYPTAPLTEVTV